MAQKPGSGRTTGSTLSRQDAREKDLLIEELNRRVSLLEQELRLMQDAQSKALAGLRQSREALRASEARFEGLFQSAGAAIFIADVESETILNCNHKAEELIGRPREELIGMSLVQLHPVIQVELHRAQFAQHARGMLTTNFETVVQHRDGRIIPVIINATAVMFDGRKIMVGFFFDVTTFKQAECALRESEEKFRVLAETTSAMIVLHQGRNLLFVNKATEAITGYSRGKLLSMDFWDLIHPASRELVKRRGTARLQADTDPPSSYETRIITRDGAEKWVYLNAGRVIYAGKPSVIVTMVDITELKRAEAVLGMAKAQAELYLDLMGHDINNMHQIALGYIEIARDTLPEDGQREYLDKSIEVLQRSTQLIKNVRKLQKLREGAFLTQAIDLCQVLTDLQSEFGAVPRKAITLSIDDCGPCYVLADELLHDVFANLVSNAIKHTGDSAEITVELRAVKDRKNRYYRVSIDDSGPGIHDDLKARIFNRAQQGRNNAMGTGLGLYLVKSLVESYRGQVWVEDRVPGDYTLGAKFVVLLPVFN